jgi:hypothetical protein
MKFEPKLNPIHPIIAKILSFPLLWSFIINLLNLCIAFRSRLTATWIKWSQAGLLGGNIHEAQEI